MAQSKHSYSKWKQQGNRNKSEHSQTGQTLNPATLYLESVTTPKGWGILTLMPLPVMVCITSPVRSASSLPVAFLSRHSMFLESPSSWDLHHTFNFILRAPHAGVSQAYFLAQASSHPGGLYPCDCTTLTVVWMMLKSPTSWSNR